MHFGAVEGDCQARDGLTVCQERFRRKRRGALECEASLPLISAAAVFQALHSSVLRRFSSSDVVEPEDGRNSLGIADGAAHHHAHRGGQRDQPLVDDFILLRPGLAGVQARGQVDSHGFGDEAGAGVELQDPFPAGGGVSRFFQEFPLSGFEFGLTRIDPAGGQFPKIVAGCVAVLAFQKNAGHGAGIVDGKNDDGAGMANHIAASRDASRFLHVIGRDPEDGAAVDFARGDKVGFGLIALRRLLARGRFGHADNIKQASAIRPQTSDLGRDPWVLI